MPKNEIKEQFEEKYNLYGDMLYKIAYLYLGNPADAEDALQEIFIKLLSRTLPFKNAEHEKAWLIRVTQNKCRDMLRSTHGVSFPENESIAAEDDDFCGAERKADVIAAIQSVPPQAKTAIILYYYYDYSVAQIAQTLKISNSAVKMRLKRGREILKSKLGDYENEK
ncbi:MAG: RNA polymerase sigma factor [Eubacterium sp.]|nr:RNA polymerase sigma factor [Eubacterium sp.]